MTTDDPDDAGRLSAGILPETAKQQAETVLRHLPDDCTLEDIQCHLYVLEKIRKGRQDIADGRAASHSEAKERLAKWLER